MPKEFRQYHKIHRLGAEENVGILIGTCYVEEKIDGANTSIWLEDGEIRMGSRTQVKIAGFNGFVDYVKSNESIKKLITEHPEYRLFGEWLVRHTVAYNETAYRNWYMYDIEVDDKFLSQEEVYIIAEKYGILTPKLFGVLQDPTLEQITEFVGKSELGPLGEGVVIKNFDFVNKFGDHEYAKIVTEKFKEETALVFGGNNKHADHYWEMYVVNKYIDMPRVEKIMHKLQPIVEKKLDMEDTSRVIGTVYHDMITEEIWEIQKKLPFVNFKVLKQLSMRKATKVYHDILGHHISVAYIKNNQEKINII